MARTDSKYRYWIVSRRKGEQPKEPEIINLVRGESSLKACREFHADFSDPADPMIVWDKRTGKYYDIETSSPI